MRFAPAISRRAVLAGGVVASLLPSLAWAKRGGIALGGTLEQASRVLGRAPGAKSVALDGVALSLTPAGDFVFGLAFDRVEPVVLTAVFADGSTEERSIAPLPRAFEEQHIDALQPEYVAPPDEILARIKDENAKIHAACSPDSEATGFEAVFAWPVSGILSSWFGSRRILNGVPKAPHFGVDIAAAEGTPIRAPAPGTVTLAEPDFYLTGGTSVLDHGHGLFTAYYHQSALNVAAGAHVGTGDVIGAVGKKGRATGPHLHWSMSWFSTPLDPSRATAYFLPPRA